MAHWHIDKTFDFCYGHRVWNQELDPELSCNSSCKCRHQHGHQGQIKVFLRGDQLKNGMVLDFVELNWFKKWVDDNLDHKMILDINDPAIEFLYPDVIQMLEYKEHFSVVSQHSLSLLTQPGVEIYEGLVFVDFVPTSENLAKWLFDVVQKKLEGIAVVDRIEFNETPKSRSIYHG